jgi:choline dehydrogenase-like flavoprotein
MQMMKFINRELEKEQLITKEKTRRCNMFDYLIVGAGFAGSVMAERLASQANKKVLIIDKRDHIAGNTFDYYNKDGILVHKYGPHIFHTNCKEVYDYLSSSPNGDSMSIVCWERRWPPGTHPY